MNSLNYKEQSALFLKVSPPPFFFLLVQVQAIPIQISIQAS